VACDRGQITTAARAQPPARATRRSASRWVRRCPAGSCSAHAARAQTRPACHGPAGCGRQSNGHRDEVGKSHAHGRPATSAARFPCARRRQRDSLPKVPYGHSGWPAAAATMEMERTGAGEGGAGRVGVVGGCDHQRAQVGQRPAHRETAAGKASSDIESGNCVSARGRPQSAVSGGRGRSRSESRRSVGWRTSGGGIGEAPAGAPPQRGAAGSVRRQGPAVTESAAAQSGRADPMARRSAPPGAP